MFFHIAAFGFFISCVNCYLYQPFIPGTAAIFTEDGDLTLFSEKTLSILTKGAGAININDNNLLDLIEFLEKAASRVKVFNKFRKWEDTLNQLDKQIMLNKEKLFNFTSLYGIKENGTYKPYINSTELTKLKLFQTQRKIKNTSGLLRSTLLNLRRNYCKNNPCKNGGTCFHIFRGVQCICPPNWEGPFCNIDVNECALFNGTDLGCQNGAVCTNTIGSYKCDCRDGWYGLHCTVTDNDCMKAKSEELCGHGVCVQDERGHSCICDQGWTVPNNTSGESNMLLRCTEDVDECNSTVLPCSHDPLVPCINTLGSFQCGSCPSGYVGNGYHCVDVDECQTDNGGCSTNPLVQCINTIGSSFCLTCPPNYSGDGKTCEFTNNYCENDNGGCHPLANCNFNAGLNTVICQCPSGYVGTGMGANGCIEDSSAVDSCNSTPCFNNGQCNPLDGGNYTCLCTPYFTGKNCEVAHTSCETNPCQNGGTCVATTYFLSHFWCRCPLGFSGILCDQMDTDCIGHFTAPVGNLTWRPSFQDTKSKSTYKSCSWSIQTGEHQKIKLIFSEFAFPSSTCLNSSSDDIRLKVYDGLSRDSNLIGVYCGSTKPPKLILSSQNTLRLDVEGHLLSSASLSIKWTSTDQKCFYDVQIKGEGDITSPGYPRGYPKNCNCEWSLSAPPGKRIKLFFNMFDIGKTGKCTDNFLLISTDKLKFMYKFCINSTLENVVTPSNFVSIVFRSDNSTGGKGFKLDYREIEGFPGCGGILSERSGVISKPSFPKSLDIYDLYCVWKIEVPAYEKVEFKPELDNKICMDKNLKIYDGPSTKSNYISNMCNGIHLSNFISTYNAVTVTYYKRFDFRYDILPKFYIPYTTVCEKTFTEESGVILSPNYPKPYPPDIKCSYTISRPIKTVIILSIIDMEIQLDDACDLDTLTIYDGNSDQFPVIKKYCGNGTIETFTSTYNTIYLQFSTDHEFSQRRGFYINYTSIDTNCGGIFTKQLGYVYNDNLLKMKECTWVIIAKPGDIIHLEWQMYWYYPSINCRNEYLLIVTNSTQLTNDGQSGNIYCRNQPSDQSITSTSNLVIIKLFSLDIEHFKFKLLYTTVKDDTCVKRFLYDAGTITSPKYPDVYPTNLNCEWIISAKEGKQIRLYIKEFKLDWSSKCTADYLEIRNGGSSNSPIIGRYCGKTIPKEIISHYNQLYLKFVTNWRSYSKGFMISWDGAANGCGGVLSTSSGSIISPNYPLAYTNNAQCFWRITVPVGNKIQLTIVDIDLEISQICTDYVEIFDGRNRLAKSFGRFCNEAHLQSLNSTSNSLFLKFYTDSSIGGKGFHITYSTVCNTEVKGHRGSIESPDFPFSFGNIYDCQWIIDAPLGNQVKIIISHFGIYDRKYRKSKTCSAGFIEIIEIDENENNTTLLDKTCRGKDIPEITSNESRVLINYKTSAYSTKTSFRLEWEVVGCGGVFKDEMSGEFTSPGYPNKYNNSMECEWYFSVPINNRIEFTIIDIQLETPYHCQSDHLDIYGGKDDTAPKLASLCQPPIGHDPYVIVTSAGNTAFVRFVSDFSRTAKGFSATFLAIDHGCGGIFSGHTGYLQSHNYPENYEPDSDCSYSISVSNGMSLNLTFTDFNIKSDENCTKAYVEAFDDEYNSLGIFCGNKLPPPLILNTNTAYLRHKSDGSLSSKGFSAHYDTICGSSLKLNYIDKRLTLETDHILAEYFLYTTLNCTWTIESDNLSNKIALTFTSLHLNPYVNSKSKAYIALYPGYNTFVAPLRNITGNKVPPTLIVPNPVTLVYHHLDRTSFSLVYSELSTACGISFNAEEGIIISPNYPDNYPPDTECQWTINLSPGNRLFLEFNDFNIRNSEHCNEDFLEIREKDLSGKLVGFFCGETLPGNLESNVSLLILFRSSENGVGKGFELHFILENGGLLTGPSGSIASPNYPAMHGVTSKVYTWQISVTSGSVVRITIKDYDIATSYDYDCEESGGLQIYDGYSSETPIWKAICKVESPFTSKNNAVFIKMTNSSPSKFLLSWEEIGSNTLNDTCNKTIVLTGYVEGGKNTYNMTSPSYQKDYMSHLECTWIITTDIENHIAIDINHVDVSYWHNLYNRLEFYDLEKNKLLHTISEDTDVKTVTGGRLLKVMLYTNTFNKGMGFTATARVECGGNIREPDGIIKLPTLTRNDSLDCRWIITAKKGQKLEIKFTKFKFPSSDPSCNTSYVMLKNGKYVDSPYLGRGKYCGKTKPPTLKSTGNVVSIHFKQESNEEIEIFYKAIYPNCHQKFYLSHNGLQSINISTPNYPNPVPPHTLCTWVITAHSEDSLHFQLNAKLLFEEGFTCEQQNLEIREGSSARSHLIHKFCSHSSSFFNTEGNALFIRYFSDIPDSSYGFSATVSLNKCGGTIIDHSWQITSPLFPKSYEPNTKCEWIFRNYHNGGFMVYFDHFKIANNQEKCNEQTVSDDIFSITNVDTGNVTYFCKLVDNDFNTFSAHSSEIKINFTAQKSAHKFADLGFHLYVQTVVSTENDEIESPGYPNSIGVVSSYRYINNIPGNRITLTITDFDWPSSNTTNNYVYFYNENQILITKLNGFQPNGTIVETTSGSMNIAFRCEQCMGYRGFKASVTYTNPKMCGGELAGVNGSMTFQHPNIPAFICTWNLEMDETMTYSVIISGNIVKQYYECGSETPSVTFDTEEYHFCRSDEYHNYTLYFNEHKVTIEAFGNQPNVDQSLNFTVMWTSQKCGGYIWAFDTNILLSPDFPNNYKPNMDCMWKYRVNLWSSMKIRFNNFTFEDDCDHDYLEITKGQDYSKVKLGKEKYCGSIVPADLIAGNEYLWFHLHTDSKNEFQGFNISITTISEDCGGFKTDDHGRIASKEYPQQYQNDMECEWIIQIQEGYHIEITFKERIQIEKSNNCTNDYLEIFDKVDNTWISIAKLCGRELISTLKSSSNEMKVLFKTNNNVTGRGFELYWKTKCGGVFKASETPQHINSPGYPRKYSGPFTCNYTIIAEYDFIKGRFLDFLLEDEVQSVCVSDYVEISTSAFEFHRYVKKKSRRYCGDKPPEEFESFGSMTIVFVVNRYNNYKGFQLEYFLDECGGLVEEQRKLSFYGSPSPYSRICKWVIRAPKNRTVKISVLNFFINCNSDMFRIYNSVDIAFITPIKKFCGEGNQEYHPINVENNEAVIYLLANNDKERTSFSVDVWFSLECGGKIALNKSEIVSFAIPKDDRSAFTCLWEVTAQENSAIKIKFTNVTMPTPCSINLNVNDGGPNDQEIYRDCLEDGFQISSTGESITFEVSSYDKLSNVSFNVDIQLHASACGKQVLNVTDDIRALTSPDFPESYPAGLNCVWLLESDTPGMLLHFEIVDIFDNSCLDYLSIWNYIDVAPVHKGPLDLRLYFPIQSIQPREIRICKKVPSFDFYPEKKAVTIRFVSGNQPSKNRGFKLTYTTQPCTRNYTNNYGNVKQFKVTKCHLVIKPKETNRTIAIYFQSVDFPFNNCTFNSLKVYDGLELTDKTLLSKICRKSVLYPVFSTGPVVAVEIDAKQPITKLDITYTTTDKGPGCGGMLMGLSGVFTSPFYPNSYRENATCVWDIETYDDYYINITFKHFDMGSHDDCEFNYLEIWNVESLDDEKNLQTLCGEDLPPSISGTSKRMRVILKTQQNEGPGFSAYYDSIKKLPFKKFRPNLE